MTLGDAYKMNETKTLGQRLYECREKTGMKQADVARALNVQRQQISYYENDSRQPDLDRLKELSRLYGVSTDYLLGITDVASIDTNLKAVCEYVGLSERSVDILHTHAEFRKEYGEDCAYIRTEARTIPIDTALLDSIDTLIKFGTHTSFFDDFQNFLFSDHLHIVNEEANGLRKMFSKQLKKMGYEDFEDDNCNSVSLTNDILQTKGTTSYVLSNEQMEEIAMMIFQRQLRSLKRSVEYSREASAKTDITTNKM